MMSISPALLFGLLAASPLDPPAGLSGPSQLANALALVEGTRFSDAEVWVEDRTAVMVVPYRERRPIHLGDGGTFSPWLFPWVDRQQLPKTTEFSNAMRDATLILVYQGDDPSKCHFNVLPWRRIVAESAREQLKTAWSGECSEGLSRVALGFAEAAKDAMVRSLLSGSTGSSRKARE